MLLRSSVTAAIMCGASLCVLWQRGPQASEFAAYTSAGVSPAAPMIASEAPAAPMIASDSPTVIDVVASAATPDLIGRSLRLDDRERVTAVNEQTAANSVVAGMMIVEHLARRGANGGAYLDLTIAGPAHERRVLILFH